MWNVIRKTFIISIVSRFSQLGLVEQFFSSVNETRMFDQWMKSQDKSHKEKERERKSNINPLEQLIPPDVKVY